MVNTRKACVENTKKKTKRESKNVNTKKKKNQWITKEDRKRGKETKKVQDRQKRMIKLKIVSPSLSVITLNDVKTLDVFPGWK